MSFKTFKKIYIFLYDYHFQKKQISEIEIVYDKFTHSNLYSKVTWKLKVYN